MSGVVVQFDPYAKTGNRMCQFAFGKILAEQKNTWFYSKPIPGFKNTHNNEKHISYSNDIISTKTFGCHYVDYEALLTSNKTILVDSYLQKIHYYEPYLESLRTMFDVESSIEVDPNELVIHIRSTDYKNGNVHIRDSIYLDILDYLSPEKISLVTDDINTDIVKTLYNQGVKIITQSNNTNGGNGLNSFEMYDYIYMLKANKLLISQSTFSWWAALLGFQQNVYVPFDLTNQTMWPSKPQKDDIDLIPANNKKFQKLIYENNKRKQ